MVEAKNITILLWLFLFPIILTISIGRKGNWQKKYKIINIILIWALVFAVLR